MRIPRPRRATTAALAASTLLAARPATADEYHFETFRYGRRAMGMGGAVTAYADEPEALIYNPAGLAMLSGLRFSGSLHFVGYDHRRQDDGLQNAARGPSEDLTSSDFVPVPASSVMSKAFGPGGRHGIALSTFLASESEESFTGSLSDPAPPGSGFDVNEQSAALDRHDSIVLYGVTYAYRVLDDLAVGLSVHWAEHERQESARRVTVLTQRGDARAGFADATFTEETTAGSLFARAGVLWRPAPEWRVGLACSTRSFGLYGEGEVSTVHVTSGDPADPRSSPQYIARRLDDLEVDSALPWGCRLGGAWVGDTWTLTADLSAHVPVEYTHYAVDDPPRPGEAPLEERSEGQPALNGAVGVEWRPAPTWPLRAGVFTNQSSAPDVPATPTRQGPAHIDAWGATLSVGHLGEHTAIALGGEAQLGTGHDIVPRDFQSLLGDTAYVRVAREDWRVVLFVSGAVGFASDTTDRLLEDPTDQRGSVK